MDVYSSDSDIEDFLLYETIPKSRAPRQVSFQGFLSV